MADIISPDTQLDLNEIIVKYSEVLRTPHYAHVGKFATAHSGLDPTSARTLVTGQPDSLAISIEDASERDFINVDLYPAGPATIVRPGFYGSDGQPDVEHGEFMRKVVRPLTEQEGRALVADLTQIVDDSQAGDRL